MCDQHHAIFLSATCSLLQKLWLYSRIFRIRIMILLMRLLRGATQYSYPQTPLEPSNQISPMAYGLRGELAFTAAWTGDKSFLPLGHRDIGPSFCI